MYAASGILILCRWPSGSTKHAGLNAPDGHMQRMGIPEAAYMYD